MQRLEARACLNIHIKRKDQKRFANSLKSLNSFGYYGKTKKFQTKTTYSLD
jgi:hypothetical protein